MPRLPVGGVCEVRQDRRIVTRLASRRSFRAEGTARAPALGLHVPNSRWLHGGVARTARSDPDWLLVDCRIGSTKFFLVTRQTAFDTPWMDFGLEALLDQTHQFRCRHRRFLLASLDEEGLHLVGQLVRVLGAAFV